MFQSEIDAGTNLLSVAFSGKVDAEEARRCREQAESLVVSLKSGFHLLTDLSALDSMDVACAPQVEQLMDVLNQHGIATVVRVIPDPHKDIGLNIDTLFGKH